MKGYVTNIERETLKNRNYEKVLFTGKHHRIVDAVALVEREQSRISLCLLRLLFAQFGLRTDAIGLLQLHLVGVAAERALAVPVDVGVALAHGYGP